MDSEVKIGTVCNNNCIFCLNEDRNTSATTQHIKEEIDKLSIAGVSIINFTGGEITIRPDYFKIIRYAKRRGLDVRIQTNGRAFYYRDFAEKTARVGIDHFLISLHAHNEELNRKLTGVPGSFMQTVGGMRNLLLLGQNVAVNVVVSSMNIPFVTEVIKHHIGLNPTSIQISWARPMGKVKSDLTLLPKYSANIENVFKSIELAKKAGKRISVVGIPPCLLGEHIDCYGRPYSNSAIISNNGLFPAENTFNQKMKTPAKSCTECDYLNACGGVFTEYIRTYGTDEFLPIKNKNKTIEDISAALNEEVLEYSQKKAGHSSINFMVRTRNSKYFIKERNTTLTDEYWEQKLKETMKKNRIHFLEPIKTLHSPQKKTEIYPFVENKISSPRMLDKGRIKTLASALGILYKESPPVDIRGDHFDKLLKFSQTAAFLDDKEKNTIKQLKNKMDLAKKDLKKTAIHNDLHLGNFLPHQGNMLITDFEKACGFYTAWDAAKTIRSIGYDPEEKEIIWENIKEFIEEYSRWVDARNLRALYPFVIFSAIEHRMNLEKTSREVREKQERQTNTQLHLFLQKQDEFQKLL